MTFGITVITYVRMCGNIVPGQTCSEYSILASKSGMTLSDHTLDIGVLETNRVTPSKS
jgi:hypothetical protein